LSITLAYNFHDAELRERALSHRSVGARNNERLEFLGDGLVNLFVAELLYEIFPRADEGELTRFRSRLVSEPSLAAIARELKLGDQLILGMGELNEANMADHPEPKPLTRDIADDYRAAWMALTSSDPTLFEKFGRMRPNANPWLKQAMQLMLRRFPDRKTGLVYWDRVMLEKVRDHAPRVSRAIAEAAVEDWDEGDFVGDYFLFGRVLKLGDERLPKPLLALSGDRT